MNSEPEKPEETGPKNPEPDEAKPGSDEAAPEAGIDPSEAVSPSASNSDDEANFGSSEPKDTDAKDPTHERIGSSETRPSEFASNPGGEVKPENPEPEDAEESEARSDGAGSDDEAKTGNSVSEVPEPDERTSEKPAPSGGADSCAEAGSNIGSDGSPSEVLSSPRRLHASSMLFEALKTARSWASAAAIPAVASLFGSGLSVWVIVLVVFGAVLLLAVSAVWGFLSWRATTYRVSGGAFHLRSGVLQKNERTIPLDHVQSVDTVQGFIQRILASVSRLEVVEVRIETAGGGAGETDASLAALTRGDAASLRREIEGARRETVGGEEAGPEVIRRLTTRELLIAGATSGQIGAAAAIIGVGSQFFDDVLDNFLSRSFVEGAFEAIAPYAFLAVALVVFAVGLFAWLLAIAGTVVSYSGFEISRSEDGKYLNIKRGFIRRYEATIPISRIQAVRITEGLLRQPFGLAMLRVESAGYGAGTEDVGVSTTLFPLLPRSEILAFLEETAPEFAVERELNSLPRRAARRYIFRATVWWVALFAVAGTVFFTSGLSVSVGPFFVGFMSVPLPPGIYVAIPAIVVLLIAAFYGWAAYRAAGWAVAGDCFVSRSRTLARVTAIAPRRRLQSRNISRSPFQRRVRLATLRTRVASGSGGATFEVVDMESSSARELIERLGPRKEGM